MCQESDGNSGVGAVGGVVVVRVGCVYRCVTRGSGIVFSADDVLEMSVVRG